MTSTESSRPIDRLDLIHVMLGHHDLPLLVQVDGALIEVKDFRYSLTENAIVLLTDIPQ